MMKNIRLLVILLVIISLFCVSCDKNTLSESVSPSESNSGLTTDELISFLFEIKDIQDYWIQPLVSSSFHLGVGDAIKYYEEFRETYPEVIELESKDDAIEKLLDFAEDCFAAEDSYGKGWSALFILDREVFRGQMSSSEREKFENLCGNTSFTRYMEWYREKYPEEYAY